MEPTRTATSEPRRLRRGPGGPRRLALLGAALLALLALVALASRGHRSPGGGELADREPPSVFWDYLFSLSLALGLLSLLIGAWLVVSGRGAEVPPQRKRRNLAGLVLLAIVLIAVSLSTRFVDPRRETPGGNPPSSAAPRLEPARAHPGPQPTRREFRWLPVLLVAGAGALAAAYFVARMRLDRAAAGEPGAEELVDELASLVEDTLDDLRAEPDPRRAVIAAYARMERALATHGLPRRAFEAPLEYLDRIARELRPEQPSATRLVFELTHLYERAKFSSHAIDTGMKEEAIATLGALRDDLAGRHGELVSA